MIRLIVLDLDGTILEYNQANTLFKSSWDGVGLATGLLSHFENLYQKYGKTVLVDYPKWVNEAVAAMKDFDFQDVLDSCLPIPYNPGCSRFLDYAVKRFKVGILSNGVGFIADEIKKEKGLDFSVAHEFEVVDGKFTGKLSKLRDFMFKAEYIDRIALQYNLGLDEVCFIGDGRNDIEVMKKVGLPIAYRPKTLEVLGAALGNGGYVVGHFDQISI